MSKYRYRPERLSDERLTEEMVERIKEHAELQLNADHQDFFPESNEYLIIKDVRIILEAAMIEYPELFRGEASPSPTRIHVVEVKPERIQP